MRSIIVALAALPASLGAQSLPRLRGFVIDVASAFPLARTSVVVTRGADTLAVTQTDSAGAFDGAAPTGDALVVHFRHIGYVADSLTIVPSELPVRVAMNRVLTLAQLPMVTVRAAATQFDRRAARSAGGHFITTEVIEKTHPLNTAELMRRIPGLRLWDSAGVMQVISQRSLRMKGPNRAAIEEARSGLRPAPADESSGPMKGQVTECHMRVAMDGILMPDGFSVNDVRPEEIYGIEVYSGVATIPIEFSSVQRDAPCGLVMIWTKSGRERRR